MGKKQWDENAAGFDKLRNAIKKQPDICSYPGCNYEIKSALRYELHLAMKHPEGNKKQK